MQLLLTRLAKSLVSGKHYLNQDNLGRENLNKIPAVTLAKSVDRTIPLKLRGFFEEIAYIFEPILGYISN